MTSHAPTPPVMQRRRKRWTVLLAASVVLAGCGQQPSQPSAPPVATQQVPPRPAPHSSSPTALDAAFAVAFGAPPGATRELDRDWEKSELTYRPAALVELGDRQALISEGKTSDCHACQGALAVHYLARRDGRLVVTGEWLEAVPGDGWGRAPEWHLRRDLGGQPVIEAALAYGNQGYDCGWLTLLELGPRGPRPLVEHVVTSYDNSGAGLTKAEGVTETTQARLVPGRDGGFSLVYEGTRAGVIRYRRVGDNMRPSGTPPIKECSG